MLSVSSRIWTRVAVSTSNDDNHYTTGTSYFKWIYNQKTGLHCKLGKRENLYWMHFNMDFIYNQITNKRMLIIERHKQNEEIWTLNLTDRVKKIGL